MTTATSDNQSKYVTQQFCYTTAQIEERRFCGEIPDPLYFIMPAQPDDAPPMMLTIIDGEPRIVKDAPPPGAILPSDNTRLYRLISTAEPDPFA
ncbi:MAG: hypothetical protein JXA21_11250 [Anaerolineae bacterium]|nr:hypothetical protein [Anaerolineae bacterium]